MPPYVTGAEPCTAASRRTRRTPPSTSTPRKRSIAGCARHEGAMTIAADGPRVPAPAAVPPEEKSDWKVVLQFFIVPLALVAVLVTVFFGLQVLRSRHPDSRATLTDLRSQGGFLLPWVGDPKRWQSGYDLSLLLRSGEGGNLDRLLPEMT